MQPCLSQSRSSWHHDGCHLPAVWSPQLLALECLGHICCQGMAAGMSCLLLPHKGIPSLPWGVQGLIQFRAEKMDSTALPFR